MAYKIEGKDQLRVLKSTVHTKLNASFRPCRQTRLSEDTIIAPSTTQSECSTLVDFNTKENVDDPPEEDVDNELLSFGNTSWVKGTCAPAALRKQRRNIFRVSSHVAPLSEEHMINFEDRAWTIPPKQAKGSSKPRRLTSLFGGHEPRGTSRTGITPEMLDPEDRAWV